VNKLRRGNLDKNETSSKMIGREIVGYKKGHSAQSYTGVFYSGRLDSRVFGGGKNFGIHLLTTNYMK